MSRTRIRKAAAVLARPVGALAELLTHIKEPWAETGARDAGVQNRAKKVRE